MERARDQAIADDLANAGFHVAIYGLDGQCTGHARAYHRPPPPDDRDTGDDQTQEPKP